MKPPCYKCTDRFYDSVEKRTCHSNCEKYARYQKQCEQIRKENHDNAQFNNYMFDNIPRLKRASPGKMFRSTKK